MRYILVAFALLFIAAPAMAKNPPRYHVRRATARPTVNRSGDSPITRVASRKPGNASRATPTTRMPNTDPATQGTDTTEASHGRIRCGRAVSGGKVLRSPRSSAVGRRIMWLEMRRHVAPTCSSTIRRTNSSCGFKYPHSTSSDMT